MRTVDTDTLPTRAPMRPRTGLQRRNIRNARRQDRSAYAQRVNHV